MRWIWLQDMPDYLHHCVFKSMGYSRWCLGNRIFHTKCLSLGAPQVRGKSKCCWSNGKCRRMITKNTHAHNKPLSMPMAMKPCQVKKNSNVSEGFGDLPSKAWGMRREETWDALWILWILWGAHFWNFAVASASPGFLSGWHLRTPAHWGPANTVLSESTGISPSGTRNGKLFWISEPAFRTNVTFWVSFYSGFDSNIHLSFWQSGLFVVCLHWIRGQTHGASYKSVGQPFWSLTGKHWASE